MFSFEKSKYTNIRCLWINKTPEMSKKLFFSKKSPRQVTFILEERNFDEQTNKMAYK